MKITEKMVINGLIDWRYDPRVNTAVPNVTYFSGYEMDLLIISKSGYATEIEVKLNISDFKNDFKKKKFHDCKMVTSMYYCVPSKIIDQVKAKLDTDFPKFGIISFEWVKGNPNLDNSDHLYFEMVKSAQKKYPAYKWNRFEIQKALYLCMLKMWSLRKKSA